MKKLWNNLKEISAKINQKSIKILFLDFDGTLAPIVKFPDDAKLSLETENLLKRLSLIKNLYIAVISGRDLKNLKRKVAIPKLIYAGINGLKGEIRGEKYTYHLTRQQLTTLAQIKRKLNNLVTQFNGTLIENKKFMISFHYRALDTNLISQLKLSFHKILDPYQQKQLIRVRSGGKVYDITPNIGWTKADFANLVIQKLNGSNRKKPLVICLGDDITDEDLFKNFQQGITVKIRKADYSHAKYYLKNTKDTFRFLGWLHTCLDNKLP